MSGSDTLDDSFPHGTVDGFKGGCRGGGCPAGAEHGLSCRKAKILSAGDYQYQRMVRGGSAPGEIAVALGLHPEIHSPAKVRPAVPRDEFEDDVPEGDALEAEAPRPVETSTKAAKPSAKKPPKRKRPGPSQVEVRTWAAANGVEVNARGSIRKDVMDAYLAAMEPSAPAGRDEAPVPSADPSEVGEAASVSRAADGTASQPEEDGTATDSPEVPNLSLDALAAEPCESFTRGTCADDPSRTPDAPYSADRYCWPCRIRAALGSSTTDTTPQVIRMHVAGVPDMETRAALFNEGWDEAMRQVEQHLADVELERSTTVDSLAFVLRKWAELHVIVSKLTAITDEQEAEISRLRIERDLAVLGEDYWAAAFRAEARTVAELRAAEHVPFWRRRAS